MELRWWYGTVTHVAMSQPGIVLHVGREEAMVKVLYELGRGSTGCSIRYVLGPIALDWFAEEVWVCQCSWVLFRQ
jgi:hypothetical protein